jgi:mannose-6-phosphate isomerase-like protein (cupin superfamily)
MSFKVFPGVEEAVQLVFAHAAADGIERFSLLTRDSVPGKSFHIAAHIVSKRDRSGDGWRFTQLHEHASDEINILLPGPSGLRYRYEVDGRVEHVEAPCAVFIAAGARHRMEPVKGAGVFLCMQLDSQEPASG